MPAAGVPERTPVAASKVTPVGKAALLSLSVGVGLPVAVTVKFFLVELILEEFRDHF